MPEKNTKIDVKLLDMLQLINENDVQAEMGEAFSSFMLNPTVTWAKFILTDDMKNGNGQRIPHEEFANLMRSGIHMPVKMAIGEIKPGHDSSKPLGSITHLKEIILENGHHAIVALAALWKQERPADIEYIQQRFADNKPVEVSWEILYTDENLNEEYESVDLTGTVLRAATVVGNPAYMGRTPFLAIAAKQEKEPINSLENNTEDELKTKEELEAQVAELEPKLTDTVAELEAKKLELAEKDNAIAELNTKLSAQEEELTSLRQFKAELDAEIAKQEKIDSIKTKFNEAGLKKDDQYFTDNAEKLLKMDENSMEFLIQELVANLPEGKASSASLQNTQIPAITGSDGGKNYDVSDLAKALRERGKK